MAWALQWYWTSVQAGHRALHAEQHCVVPSWHTVTAPGCGAQHHSGSTTARLWPPGRAHGSMLFGHCTTACESAVWALLAPSGTAAASNTVCTAWLSTTVLTHCPTWGESAACVHQCTMWHHGVSSRLAQQPSKQSCCQHMP